MNGATLRLAFMFITVCLLVSDESTVFGHLKGKLHFQKLGKKADLRDSKGKQNNRNI